MKNLIIYKSKTGFTKEYAEMLERRITGEIVEISKLKSKDIVESDNIFYGGPLRNNVILGLDKFLKHHKQFQEKNVFIFGVGIEPSSDEKRSNVICANGLDLYHVRLYLLQGGLDFSKLKFPMKQFLKFGMKSASKKEEINEELINQRLENPINFVNSSNLDRMVDVYRRVIIKK